jgi:mono/diheme cytochrome c family protein
MSESGRQGDVAPGQQVFVKNCAICHGDNGKGGSAPRLAGNSLSLDQIQKKVTEGGSKMPSFKEQLTPSDIKAVAAYVKSLGTKS